MEGGREMGSRFPVRFPIVYQPDPGSTTLSQCRHVPDNVISKNKIYDLVAEFYPPSWMRTPSNPIDVARMTEYPPGPKHFDEILMAVLILERKRRKLITRRGRGI